jgi:hypothetical protein
MVILKKKFSYGQIGDGTKIDKIFPVAVNKTSFYGNYVYKLSSFDTHTCVIHSPKKSCFLILYDDLSVCNGHGKKNFKS